LGNTLQALGRVDEAIGCFRDAQALEPQTPMAHWNEALALLLKGDFPAGFEKFQWRWAFAPNAHHGLSTPEWDGNTLKGRTLLIHTEQGLGDGIQFARFLPALKKKSGAKLILRARSGLLHILKGMPGVDGLVDREAPTPAHDAHLPLMCAPRLLGVTLKKLPAEVPYIGPTKRPTKVKGAPKQIGLVWRGSPTNADDRLRSVPVEALQPILARQDVRLVVLQHGVTAAERDVLAQHPDVRFITDVNKDFAQTMAVLPELDRLVSVDTSVAHLAGAMACPTFIALQKVGDWRWLLDRADSPWYPTVKLFRQQRQTDWAGVFEAIAQAL
jgi:hypothetical protein